MNNYQTDKVKSLYILDKDTLDPTSVWNDISNLTIESEIEPSSLANEVLQYNHSASFKGELTDCSLFNDDVTNFNDKQFYMQSYIPIMVQARWHKKHRINKKWLKRYGMKEDNVLVKCKVTSICANPVCENPYEIEHIFNLDLDNIEYKFRPDQLRRNLKMELY